jgi:LysR family hydrogen peroxide-inducible transcriptional activator
MNYSLQGRRPDFQQLEVFLAVVETRSFVAAARQLGRTQPAVSQTIRRLEDIFGGDLFKRHRNAPVELTPIGIEILPFARTLLDTVDRQVRRAMSVARGRTGALAIGVSCGLAAGPFRRALIDLAQGSPEIDVQLFEAHPADLHRQLNERTIDLVIAACVPNVASATISAAQLWQDRLFVGVPSDHDLAGKALVTWSDVGSLHLIQRCSAGYRGRYRPIWLPVSKYLLVADHHNVSSDTIFEMVSMGLGATIAIESVVGPHEGVTFCEIAESDAFAQIDAIWLTADSNPLRHRFLSLLRDHV